MDDDCIFDTPCPTTSNRKRQPIGNPSDKNVKKRAENKRPENIPIRVGQQRIATRSSQKSPITPVNNESDDSFVSNINSGLSKFVNPKKRQREEKTTTKSKRSRIVTNADENEFRADSDVDNEIEQIKLVSETAGHTNVVRSTSTNVDNRVANILPKMCRSPTRDTTFTILSRTVEESQLDSLPIADTLLNNESQHNDSSWQRDIDRLMRKLEEPSCSVKSQTQIEEQNISKSIHFTQTTINEQQSNSTVVQSTTNQNLVNQTNEIGVQTEKSSIHHCCQDVSICPCVLRYSKLERLFMEKMSNFIRIVPTVTNSGCSAPSNEVPRRRNSRWRRMRVRRRIAPRTVNVRLSDDETTTVEQITVQTTTEYNERQEENVGHQQFDELIPIDVIEKDEVVRPPIISRGTSETIAELSSIERLETTINNEFPSTLLISSTNDNSLTRRLVLTTSSLDETQKTQFRSFVTRFDVSTTSTVDSSTSHVIINEHSPLVCPLTGKIIQGIARHLFIVSYRWLIECLKEESLVDERPFEIRGDTSLGCDHGGMRRSRLTPTNLLDNFSICLRCSSNDCAPLQNIEQVQELIQICGGKLFHHFSQIQTIDKQRQIVLVLGLNGFTGGDKKRQTLLDTCQQFHVKCVNIHWLLISIAKFDLQSFDYYNINQV